MLLSALCKHQDSQPHCRYEPSPRCSLGLALCNGILFVGSLVAAIFSPPCDSHPRWCRKVILFAFAAFCGTLMIASVIFWKMRCLSSNHERKQLLQAKDKV